MITRSLPSDRRTPLVYVALGDSTVYGLGASSPNAAVILNALPDLASAPRFREAERSMVAALTRHYNHALRHVADGFGVDLVDLEISGQPESELTRLFSEDGYHPSDEGYAAWAGALWEAVQARIPERMRLTATPA